jgi:acetyl esterase
VTRWALEQAQVVAVAGDSSGGNLAAATAVRARDAGLSLAFQLLIYPITSYDFSTPSYLVHGEGRGLSRAELEWCWALYLGDADGTHPRASPLRTPSLEGVAAALIVVCEFDPLHDEGVAYAKRLKDAGVRVQLADYAGLIHGVIRRPAVIARGREVLDDCGNALRRALAAAAPTMPRRKNHV